LLTESSAITQWAKSPKNSLKECDFVNSAVPYCQNTQDKCSVCKAIHLLAVLVRVKVSPENIYMHAFIHINWYEISRDLEMCPTEAKEVHRTGEICPT